MLRMHDFIKQDGAKKLYYFIVEMCYFVSVNTNCSLGKERLNRSITQFNETLNCSIFCLFYFDNQIPEEIRKEIISPKRERKNNVLKNYSFATSTREPTRDEM